MLEDLMSYSYALFFSLQDIDKDGLAEEDKIQLKNLSDLSADDITFYGNTCNMYSNKTLISKTFKSRFWQERFTEIIAHLKDRRTQFDSALSLISTTTIIQVNERSTATDHKYVI